MMEAVALFDYTARTNKELSFKIKQIIYISKQINDQWWLGYIPENNQSGFIPDGYIKFKSKYVMYLIIYNYFFVLCFCRRRESTPIRQRTSSLYSSNNKLDPPLVNQHHSTIPISTNGHDHSSSHSTLREDNHVKSLQAENDAPDLVLNLPISNGFLTSSSSSKSFDETIPIVHSTIIIDLEEQRLPSKIEKSMQVIKHLGLQQQQSISICGSAKATEV